MTVRAYLMIPVLLLVAGLAACGGGGGGASDPAPPLAGVGVSSGSSVSLSGAVTDDASPSQAPLAGATVALYPTGVKLSGLQPLATATTAANGTWSIASGPAAGTYLLQIAPPDSAHATLHKDVTLAAGANAIGTTELTILSATEQQCITLFNQQRTTLGMPALGVDNAAMIAARAEAQAVSSWDGQGSPGGSNAIPAVTPTIFANAGGVGSVPGYDYDAGANSCTMAISNLFAPGSGQSDNTSTAATWTGFGIAPDPIANSDYAAAVVTYP